jgi:hypothetical protein
LNGADVSAADTILDTFYSTYSGQAAAANWGTAGLSDADVIGFTSIANLPTTALTP